MCVCWNFVAPSGRRGAKRRQNINRCSWRKCGRHVACATRVGESCRQRRCEHKSRGAGPRLSDLAPWVGPPGVACSPFLLSVAMLSACPCFDYVGSAGFSVASCSESPSAWLAHRGRSVCVCFAERHFVVWLSVVGWHRAVSLPVVARRCTVSFSVVTRHSTACVPLALRAPCPCAPPTQKPPLLQMGQLSQAQCLRQVMFMSIPNIQCHAHELGTSSTL